MPTIDLTAIPAIDEMPICEVEDCSDVAAVAQPGVWFDPDSHDTYVMWTDGPALLITDDTVTGPYAFARAHTPAGPTRPIRASTALSITLGAVLLFVWAGVGAVPV